MIDEIHLVYCFLLVVGMSTFALFGIISVKVAIVSSGFVKIFQENSVDNDDVSVALIAEEGEDKRS